LSGGGAVRLERTVRHHCFANGFGQSSECRGR
jgi:hypothetical protein